ncbi:hypothetical protein BZA05DRAFT_206796 [Tricharina praecox]|uniref:uncharacterized protein n=1 Tax=Tricharina praecox TaxID=43433 RepID=UPI0022204983|nr:uncharacterized protein BZA05DRAFT_206796 [Tricharina praecox]KAI5842264.1 hypothetical protein BZA05DRAFT_206796 [Tricharina praecox]
MTTPQPRSSWWYKLRERFGLLQPALLLVSTMGIFLVVGALISLWTWTVNDNPSSVRSRILYTGWCKSIIAIFSAILRTCMAVQVGTCCLMMATLAFEKDCVLLQDAASMSIRRYAASSPFTLASPVFRGARVSKNFGIVILIVFLSLAMVLSQALSAILLHDLHLDYVRGPRSQETYQTHVGEIFDASPIDPLGQRPLTFPRFAERIGRSFALSENPTSRGLRDTGATVRAYPEFGQASDRSSLLYYHGRGAVMEAHVLCVSPDIDELVLAEHDRVTGRLRSDYLYASAARLEAEGSYRWNGAQPAADLVWNFNCTLGDVDGVSLCPLKPPASIPCPGFPTPCLLAPTNAWFLIMDEITPGWTEFGGGRMAKDEPLVQQLYNRTGYVYDGTEWVTKIIEWSSPAADPPNVSAQYGTRMSLCVVASGNSMATIKARAGTRADEPEYSSRWGNVSTTNAIQSQLSSGPDLDKRGIMELVDYSVSEYKEFTHVVQTIRGGYAGHLTREAGDDGYDDSVKLEQLEDTYVAMLAFHLWNNDTNSSIAFGLQGIFSLLTSRVFYDSLTNPQEDWRGVHISDDPASTASATTPGAPAENDTSDYRFVTRTVQMTKSSLVPIQITGLLISCGILGFHLLSVATVFWLYFTCKAPKFLDQAWRTVGQLYRGQGNVFLHETGSKCDLEVARLPGAVDNWKKTVRLTRESEIAVKDGDAAKGAVDSNATPVVDEKSQLPDGTGRVMFGDVREIK